MACLICSLKNVKLQNEIERRLDINGGYLTEEDKKELKSKEEFANCIDVINKLTPQECEVHWNFHQSSGFAPSSIDSTREREHTEGEQAPSSIRDEIGRDEASVLYDLMAKQMTTFNCLSRRINAALNDGEVDMTCVPVNPVLLEFYRGITSDIRSNIKALSDLNQAVNGEKNGSIEGLKAIAVALTTPLENKNDPMHDVVDYKDMSTKEYDY